jgi:hypothetical protein
VNTRLVNSARLVRMLVSTKITDGLLRTQPMQPEIERDCFFSDKPLDLESVGFVSDVRPASRAPRFEENGRVVDELERGDAPDGRAASPPWSSFKYN